MPVTDRMTVSNLFNNWIGTVVGGGGGDQSLNHTGAVQTLVHLPIKVCSEFAVDIFVF